MPQPPLLCEEGNTPHTTFLQFIHVFYERPDVVFVQVVQSILPRPVGVVEACLTRRGRWLVPVPNFRFSDQSPQHRLSQPRLFRKDGRSLPAAEGYNRLDRLLPAWASREFGGTDYSCVRREGRDLPGRSYSARSDGT